MDKAVSLRAREEAELVLRLDDAAEEAKENEGEYISLMCAKSLLTYLLPLHSFQICHVQIRCFYPRFYNITT